VFNIKRSSYDFNFYLIYTGISSVGNWAFLKKNSSHHLVLSDNLNRRIVDWIHLLQA
jgi:hypothetical protein